MSHRANPQDNALRETFIRDPQIPEVDRHQYHTLTQALGEPVTIATTSIIAACGIRPLPTTLRWNTAAAPDHSTQPHTTHEFSKASGNLLRGSPKRPDGKPLALELPARPRNEFPPVIPQRVALQQSPLALGRPHHIVNPNRRALPINKLPTGCLTAVHRPPPHQHGAGKNHWRQHTTTGTMKSKPGQDFPP